jgi:hypothetical protein
LQGIGGEGGDAVSEERPAARSTKGTFRADRGAMSDRSVSSRDKKEFGNRDNKAPVREDNVQLSLSPKMMELAEELAAEMKMGVRTYLLEILKYAILAHGKRLNKQDKYVAEFTNTNQKLVSSWSPEG